VLTATAVLVLTAAYPLWRAWTANRTTTLRHALGWAVAAWLGWVGALLAAGLAPAEGAVAARYGALCLTGCAGVAVLEPRRPGVLAWHFITFGLFVVLLLPLGEGWGHLQLGPVRAAFLGAILAVGLLNYLPTRLAPGVLLLAVGCGLELGALVGREGADGPWLAVAGLAVGVAPWAALTAGAGAVGVRPDLAGIPRPLRRAVGRTHPRAVQPSHGPRRLGRPPGLGRSAAGRAAGARGGCRRAAGAAQALRARGARLAAARRGARGRNPATPLTCPGRRPPSR
jgi:hypothetical protein